MQEVLANGHLRLSLFSFKVLYGFVPVTYGIALTSILQKRSSRSVAQCGGYGSLDTEAAPCNSLDRKHSGWKRCWFG